MIILIRIFTFLRLGVTENEPPGCSSGWAFLKRVPRRFVPRSIKRDAAVRGALAMIAFSQGFACKLMPRAEEVGRAFVLRSQTCVLLVEAFSTFCAAMGTCTLASPRHRGSYCPIAPKAEPRRAKSQKQVLQARTRRATAIVAHIPA